MELEGQEESIERGKNTKIKKEGRKVELDLGGTKKRKAGRMDVGKEERKKWRRRKGTERKRRRGRES